MRKCVSLHVSFYIGFCLKVTFSFIEDKCDVLSQHVAPVLGLILNCDVAWYWRVSHSLGSEDVRYPK